MSADLYKTRPGQACLEQGKFSLSKETEDVDPFRVPSLKTLRAVEEFPRLFSAEQGVLAVETDAQFGKDTSASDSTNRVEPHPELRGSHRVNSPRRKTGNSGRSNLSIRTG